MGGHLLERLYPSTSQLPLSICLNDVKRWPIMPSFRLTSYTPRETWDQEANGNPHQALEVAARSQGDNPADQSAGKEAVLKMVADETIIKDIHALNLYDWACSNADFDYSTTVGVLRMRLIKAVPKDSYASSSCFKACLQHLDWTHTQQVLFLCKPSVGNFSL
jgi:hypothetical protein